MSLAGSFAVWCRAVALRLCGAVPLARWRLRRERAVVVLMMHRVLGDAEFARSNSQSSIVLRERVFRQMMGYLKKRFDVVAPSGRVFEVEPERVRLVLTFDDGWADLCSNAVPAAREHGCTVTAFVCPGRMASASPYWPENVLAALRNSDQSASEEALEPVLENLKSCPREVRLQAVAALVEGASSSSDAGAVDRTLSWAEAEALTASQVFIGSHTVTHEILPTVPAEMARREIRESKLAIERMLGAPCLLFSYPNGGCSDDLFREVAEAGYELAFTTRCGFWTPATNPMAIPRINVCDATVCGPWGGFSPSMFEYAAFWRSWRAGSSQ